MKILISGSTGLVGSALVPALQSSGHEVVRLVRSLRVQARDRSVTWDPMSGQLSAASLEGIDAAVHLAGENIAARRWTPAQKALIRESRVAGTRLLAETLAKLKAPPKALVCASAIGFYGDRSDQRLNEDSPAGTGFLADTCREWEAAAKPAADRGIRVVHLRTGIVLASQGGALAKMLTPFRLGIAGIIGTGQQYMSWISLDDLVAVISFALSKRDAYVDRSTLLHPTQSPITNSPRHSGECCEDPPCFPCLRLPHAWPLVRWLMGFCLPALVSSQNVLWMLASVSVFRSLKARWFTLVGS